MAQWGRLLRSVTSSLRYWLLDHPVGARSAQLRSEATGKRVKPDQAQRPVAGTMQRDQLVQKWVQWVA